MVILRDVHVNQLKQHSIIDNGMAMGLDWLEMIMCGTTLTDEREASEFI